PGTPGRRRRLRRRRAGSCRPTPGQATAACRPPCHHNRKNVLALDPTTPSAVPSSNGKSILAVSGRAWPREGDAMTLLAHISDLHLNGTPRATERVERAAAYLRSLSTPPDALLVT